MFNDADLEDIDTANIDEFEMEQQIDEKQENAEIDTMHNFSVLEFQNLLELKVLNAKSFTMDNIIMTADRLQRISISNFDSFENVEDQKDFKEMIKSILCKLPSLEYFGVETGYDKFQILTEEIEDYIYNTLPLKNKERLKLDLKIEIQGIEEFDVEKIKRFGQRIKCGLKCSGTTNLCFYVNLTEIRWI